MRLYILSNRESVRGYSTRTYDRLTIAMLVLMGVSRERQRSGAQVPPHTPRTRRTMNTADRSDGHEPGYRREHTSEHQVADVCEGIVRS